MDFPKKRVIEVIGPAGAGKTTLWQALCCQRESFHPRFFPDVRKLTDLPFFIRNGLQIAPVLFGLPERGSRKLTRREFAWLSILHGWPDRLRKESGDHGVIILDQGPVYLLTEMYEFGPEYLRQPKADHFWQDLYSRWAETLAAVVWLDAPDAVLLERIRGRGKDHIVKNQTAETTFDFFARFRGGFERTITHLTANQKNLKVIRYITSQVVPEEIVNELLLEFNSNQSIQDHTRKPDVK